jgi:hypothetical protein
MEYLRISGIYDQQTIHQLKQQGVSQFTFDFRPTSFNFTQAKKVKEIIADTYGHGDSYSLQFESDKDFVINGVLDDLSKVPHVGREDFKLEFMHDRTLEDCESFKLPFIWHFNAVTQNEFLKAKNLSTVVFNQTYIHQLDMYQKLYPFMEGFFKQLPAGVKVELQMDWSTPVMETLVDFFPINGLSFHINQQVERSYRQVDLQLVSQHIEHTKQSLNL